MKALKGYYYRVEHEGDVYIRLTENVWYVQDNGMLIPLGCDDDFIFMESEFQKKMVNLAGGKNEHNAI